MPAARGVVLYDVFWSIITGLLQQNCCYQADIYRLTAGLRDLDVHANIIGLYKRLFRANANELGRTRKRARYPLATIVRQDIRSDGNITPGTTLDNRRVYQDYCCCCALNRSINHSLFFFDQHIFFWQEKKNSSNPGIGSICPSSRRFFNFCWWIFLEELCKMNLRKQHWRFHYGPT